MYQWSRGRRGRTIEANHSFMSRVLLQKNKCDRSERNLKLGIRFAENQSNANMFCRHSVYSPCVCSITISIIQGSASQPNFYICMHALCATLALLSQIMKMVLGAIGVYLIELGLVQPQGQHWRFAWGRIYIPIICRKKTISGPQLSPHIPFLPNIPHAFMLLLLQLHHYYMLSTMPLANRPILMSR